VIVIGTEPAKLEGAAHESAPVTGLMVMPAGPVVIAKLGSGLPLAVALYVNVAPEDGASVDAAGVDVNSLLNRGLGGIVDRRYSPPHGDAAAEGVNVKVEDLVGHDRRNVRVSAFGCATAILGRRIGSVFKAPVARSAVAAFSDVDNVAFFRTHAANARTCSESSHSRSSRTCVSVILVQ
jgi:hypothetical protein